MQVQISLNINIFLQTRKEKVSGNLSGDGLQNGGLMVVKKGGTQLLLFDREDVPGDHVTNEAILESLGIAQEPERDYFP